MMNWIKEKNITSGIRRERCCSGNCSASNQCASSQFFERKHLYRPRKGGMCSRLKLLFMPGSGRILSHWIVSGGCGILKVPFLILYHRDHDSIRCYCRAADLRIFLPVRMVSGFAAQDSDQKVFHSEIVAAALSEIHHFDRDGLAAGRLPGR